MRFVGDGRLTRPDAHPHMLDRIFEKYRTDSSFHVWAVEADGRYAGHAELKRRAGRTEYELIYVLKRECWGRGIGGAVVDLLLARARAEDVPFVIATVAEGNVASRAILYRRGFARDDRLSAELEAPAFRLDL